MSLRFLKSVLLELMVGSKEPLATYRVRNLAHMEYT